MSTPLLVSYVALWVVAAFQTLMLLGLTHAVHALRQEGASDDAEEWRGRSIPDFSAVDLAGGAVSPATLAGRAAVLLFVSPNCPSCAISPAEVHVLAGDPARQLVVVCRAGRDDCARFAVRHDLAGPVVADEAGTVTELFGVSRPPTAVRVDAEGIVESYGVPLRGDEAEEALQAPPELVGRPDGRADDLAGTASAGSGSTASAEAASTGWHGAVSP